MSVLVKARKGGSNYVYSVLMGYTDEIPSNITLEEVEKEIIRRDQKDTNRETSPFVKASDAIEISTDGLTIDEVTQKIVDLYGKLTRENPK